jgi:hypothetical protein
MQHVAINQSALHNRFASSGRVAVHSFVFIAIHLVIFSILAAAAILLGISGCARQSPRG